MSERAGPFRLKPLLVERVWGSHNLGPWYTGHADKPIGEAWLSGDDCVIETGPLAGTTLKEAAATLGQDLLGSASEKFPLLVKILFPQDKLSVQVHPDDADAARLGSGTEAKTECWYILQADPGATVALGLKPGTSTDAVRQAIGDGTLESLVENVPVATGDMVYVSAGTIHAIGAGVVILEVQQNSDTTYRLYDYGRPRELHLDKGLDVLKLNSDAGKVASSAIDGGTELIAVPHFTVQRYEINDAPQRFKTSATPDCLIALSGSGAVLWDGDEVELLVGQAVIVPASVTSYAVQGDLKLVRCFV